jgi:hypothetical protein
VAAILILSPQGQTNENVLFVIAALAIGLAERAFALSGNLAEDIKAFDEFNALRIK